MERKCAWQHENCDWNTIKIAEREKKRQKEWKLKWQKQQTELLQ